METRRNEYATVVHKPGEIRLLHEKYDSLFKHIVGSGWCVKSDGNVEAPQGYYSITEIPAHEGEFLNMVESVFTGLTSEWNDPSIWPAAGWYVTIENSDGIIFVYETADETEASLLFAWLDKQYIDWSEAGNLP
jgi:hypothetical protein